MIKTEKRLPNLCPSCGHTLTVCRFGCDNCDTTVEGTFGLPILARLSPDDQALVISLIKTSGSLKDMAREYGVSYPTIRNRLDELIKQVEGIQTETKNGGD